MIFTSNSFAQFSKLKTIELPENHLIGDIQTLDVLGDSYLFMDMNKQIFLFKEASDKLIKLNPEDCHPGFKLQPIEVFHLPDGSIFLVNAGLPGYRFNTDGSCQGIVEKGFGPAYHHQTEVDQNGNIYTITPGTQRPVILTIHDKTGKPIDTFELNKTPYPQFDNRYKGGGMIIHDQVLFYILSSGASIQLFDISIRKHLSQIAFEPEYKPAITEDFPPDPYEAIKKLRSIMEEHYVIHEMYKLSDDMAIIQTQFQIEGEGKFGLHKLNLVTKEVSLMTIQESPFIFVADKKGYKIEDDRMEDEHSMNPKITVYRFNN